jgi:hypothetical protein
VAVPVNKVAIESDLCIIYKDMDFSEPRNFREWASRVFAFRPVFLILIIFGIVISEMRFDWAEHMLGSYLVTTNAQRPESGSIWEVGHRTVSARQRLEKLITDRQSSQREARGADTFTQLVSSLPPGQGVMLSSEHFKRLYLALPGTIAHEVIEPLELLRLLSEGRWVRTYLENEDYGLKIYLLNHENRVLRDLRIPTELFYQIERVELALQGTLDDLPTFENRIYPAERFFEALNSLPDEDLGSVISQAKELLNTPGRIVRVGISDEAVSGYIEIGFEIEDGTRRKVILVKGREWAVWLLRLYLEDMGAETQKTSVREQIGDQE